MLPDSLFDAVQQAAAATAAAIQQGQRECLVELLVPELFDSVSGSIMASSGDQQRQWELCRFFVEALGKGLGDGVPLAVFPDAGCAAGLRARWATPAPPPFRLASLDDRGAAREGDAVAVLCCPDPVGADAAERIADACVELGVPLVLLNPRLASGDAGLGLNARRARQRFLGRTTQTYLLKPVGEGSLFRRWPSPFLVFGPDAATPGRFRLLAELPARPDGEEVADLLDAGERQGEDGREREATLAEGLARAIASARRFTNSLFN